MIDDLDRAEVDNEALQFLVDYGYLDECAEGITKRVIAEGEGTLSPKQQYVFDKYVREPHFGKVCKRCQEEVSASDIIGLWVNEGYCGRCAYRMEKEDRRGE